ncbi:MAG: GH92 family glycosyl hydrolase [Anaerococcus sp.]|nr:GH92 family glycosyl hydrolase [Anaerococcus sp.]
MDIISKTLKDIRFTDIRVGTDSKREFSNGNTLPLVGSPHANNYLTLRTNDDPSFFFNPHDKRLLALRLTHQPSPWMGDFSYFEILPFVDKEEISYNNHLSIFRPNFARIYYNNGGVLSFTSFDSRFFIRFKADKEVSFILRAKGLSLEKNARKIQGEVINFAGCEDDNFTMHISLSLEVDFDLEKKGEDYYIKTKENQVTIKGASSFISKDQANLNLARAEDTFDQMVLSCKKAWDKYFDIFKIEEKDYQDNFAKYDPYNKKDRVKFFYHCVYRAMVFPMKFFELDENQKPIHYDTLARKVRFGKLYTNIGFWDGQKTLFPLLSLIAPDDLEDILEAILNFYKETSYLPKWLSPDERGLMPGTLVDNVIADALTKGIGARMAEDFLKAMIDTANKEDPSGRYGRAGAKVFRDLSYIPASYPESVNQTLDNCLADYSISKVAGLLGKTEIEKTYRQYSSAWINLFDKDTKLLRAKDEEGNFIKDFDPLAWGGPYTEGSAYQNSYNAYHDLDKLVKLFPSKKDFEKRLDDLANMDSTFKPGGYGGVIHEMEEMGQAHFGQMSIYNQPAFHLPYLYKLIGSKEKTQYLVKTLLLDYFSYSLDGFPGDEDNGSMAAWFILSAMGIYPLSPASGSYELGIGLFDKMEVKLPAGNKLIIEVEENYPHKRFVDYIKKDGQRIDQGKISHEALLKASHIKFRLNLCPRNKDDK